MKYLKQMPYDRTERVGDSIGHIIALALVEEVSDPRMTNCSITSVKMSKDLKHARVYFSVIGRSSDQIRQTVRALSKAEGFFKRRINQKLKLKYMPALSFEHDDSLEHGAKLLSLIKEANVSDDTDDSDDHEN